MNWCAVRDVSQATFMRRNALVDRIKIGPIRESNVDVGVLEPEPRVNVRRDFIVSLDDILDINIDEIVERVYVLLDKSLYFKKGGKKKPFILIVWSYDVHKTMCSSEQTYGHTSTLLIGSVSPSPRQFV
jgi:hypothetical protein